MAGRHQTPAFLGVEIEGDVSWDASSAAYAALYERLTA
jgi:hypothetical protein